MEQLKAENTTEQQVKEQHSAAGDAVGGNAAADTAEVHGHGKGHHGHSHGHGSCGRCRNCRCHEKHQHETV